jgi:LacI family gluconate utilization system Gnt-I transcriptional repressor
MRGFEDELRLAGRPTDWVIRHGQAPVSYEHGAAVTPILLAREPRPDAVFAVSDLSAVGVVMECQRRGVRVPEDLSVMGFGDFEIGAQINPRLTSIHVDFRGLGETTGRLLKELLGNGAGDVPKVIDVGLSVVERSSVRNAS